MRAVVGSDAAYICASWWEAFCCCPCIVEIKRKEIKINFKDYLYMLILGIICIPMSMVLFQLGVMKANAAMAALIMCQPLVHNFSRISSRKDEPL